MEKQFKVGDRVIYSNFLFEIKKNCQDGFCVIRAGFIEQVIPIEKLYLFNLKVGDYVTIPSGEICEIVNIIGDILGDIPLIKIDNKGLNTPNLYLPKELRKLLVQPKFKVGDFVNGRGCLCNKIIEVNYSKVENKFVYKICSNGNTLKEVYEEDLQKYDATNCLKIEDLSIGDIIENAAKMRYEVFSINYNNKYFATIDVKFDYKYTYLNCNPAIFNKIVLKRDKDGPLLNPDGYYHYFFSAQQLNGVKEQIGKSESLFDNINIFFSGFSPQNYKIISRDGTPGVLIRYKKD